MPLFPEHSLLRVELPGFNGIDTTSVEDLYEMWSIFSKTSRAMQNGRRMENMTWRLMNRETVCCLYEPEVTLALPSPPTAPYNTAQRLAQIPEKRHVPALSTSPDSESEDESVPQQLLSRPPCHRLNSSESSRNRNREKHMAPINIEKMVSTILETGLEPIELPVSTPAVRARDFLPTTSVSQSLSRLDLNSSSVAARSSDGKRSPTSQHSTTLDSSTSTFATGKSSLVNSQVQQPVGSQESSATEMSTHSIIRGFVAGGAPSSYRSQTHLHTQPTPILKTSAHHATPAKKKGAMFTIGTSSGEDESSLESHMYKSSISERMKRGGPSEMKKQAAFKDEVVEARAIEHSPVFDDSDEDDEEISESAIEDEDDSDWEDSDDASGPSSINEKELFQRVDSRPNLASRRSLLTSALHEPDRARALAEAASRSTPALRRSRNVTPNGPSLATSPSHPVPAVQWSTQASAGQGPTPARPIMTTSNMPHQLSLSPRTTRRNMLSTELTESLRKNLLWERQHRSTGNLAAMKRRHTSHDVKNLRQQPEAGPHLTSHPAQFNNDFFHAGLGEYHAKGW